MVWVENAAANTGKPIKAAKNKVSAAIAFAVFMALVGYSVMVTVPVLSTALVNSLGFTEEQVGRVWGNDMLGFSIGAVVAALSVARVNRRHLVMGGIVLTIGVNALCMSVTDYESMMWLCFALYALSACQMMKTILIGLYLGDSCD